MPRSQFIIFPNFVSSLNFIILPCQPRSRTLIYIRKSKGPNTDPWETPLQSFFQSDVYLWIVTLCFPIFSKFSTHCGTAPFVTWALDVLTIYSVAGYRTPFDSPFTPRYSITHDEPSLFFPLAKRQKGVFKTPFEIHAGCFWSTHFPPRGHEFYSD